MSEQQRRRRSDEAIASLLAHRSGPEARWRPVLVLGYGLAWIGLMLLAGACSRPPAGDTRGDGETTARVVSLSPALTEVLFAVGCGPTLVARDGWSDFPPAARQATELSGLVPPVEAVVATRPSIVLTHFPPAKLRTGLDAAGVKWLGLAPERLADVAGTFARVGAVCGRQAAAMDLARDWRAAVQELRSTRRNAPRPRVYLELDPGSGRPHTVGRGTFLDDVVRAAGGANVMADAGRWVQVSTEQVLAARPEVIVITASPAAAPTAIKALMRRPGWAHLPAVRQGRVFAISPDLLSRPGPRLLLGLRALAGHLSTTPLPALPASVRAALGS